MIEKAKRKYFNKMTPEQKLQAFRDILSESESVVFLGGAGVSTESGIPDFRSKNGLHQKAGSKNVAEIHGTIWKNHCISCGKSYDADCLIIGGTSLEVGSASGLAHQYHGKYLVIINKGRTKMMGKADLVFHDSIGRVLSML